MWRALLAVLFFVASPAAAQPQPAADFEAIYDLTQAHCQRLMYAPLKAAPQLRQRIEALEHDPRSPAPVENAYENAPDFGFLLPHYWPVMSWAQRVRFNHAYTALLKQRLQLSSHSKDENTHCQPQIRMMVDDEALNENNDDALPASRRLKALALQTLPDAAGEPLPLSYLLSGTPPSGGWKMEDIIIGNESLHDADSTKLEDIIRLHGMDNFEDYFTKLLP